MRRIRIFGLALTAMLLMSVAVSAVAHAENKENLPLQTVETNGEIKEGGEAELQAEKANIKCKTLKATLTALSKRLGDYTIDFTGCTVLGAPVNSLGDVAGTILTGGEYHLVLSPGGSGALIWLLVAKENNKEALHLEAPKLGLLFLIWGNLLGSISPVGGGKTTKFKINVKAKESKQEFTEFINNNGEPVKAAGLSVSVNGGEAKPAGEDVLKEAEMVTTEKTEITLDKETK